MEEERITAPDEIIYPSIVKVEESTQASRMINPSVLKRITINRSW